MREGGSSRESRRYQGYERSVINVSDPGYPGLLRKIPDPPKALYAVGDANRCSEDGSDLYSEY